MGVLPMSLINQMLKDLDARRSDVSGEGPFGQQIRAVPDRRRVHPAWWATLVLAGILVAMLAFILLRPVPAAPQGAAAHLPLKLDIGLSTQPGAEQAGTIVPPAASADSPIPVPAAGAPLSAVLPASAPQTAASDNAAGPVAHTASAERKPAATTSASASKGRREAPVPRAAELVPPVTALVPAPIAKAPETVPPSVLQKQIKEMTPAQRAENEYRKAVVALQQGKKDDALAGFERALQLDSGHFEARQALIGVLLDAKRQDEALERAREGLHGNPAQPGLAMILARLQLEKGELRSAIDTLERTLPHASERADYLAFLAALLQRDQRHKQAAEHYLLALQKVPQNGVWWMGLGISLEAEHRPTEAQESFKRAKATNSLSPELLAFVDAKLSALQR